MSDCTNHPGVPATKTCARCGQPYCDSCLVEFLGARYCGPCRNLKLAEAQGYPPASQTPIFAATGNVDIGRWLTAGWQMVSADLATWMIATLLTLVLTAATCVLGAAAVTCGMYLMAFRKQLGHPISATDVTLGFRRFLNSLGAFLLLSLPGFAVGIVQQIIAGFFQFAASGSSEQPNVGAIGLLLLVTLGMNLVSMVVSAAIATIGFFTFAHIAARNVNPIAAISDSWAVVRRNPWMFLLAAILFQLIGVLGIVVFCVGCLITIPLMIAATAQAYADHFGLEYAQVE